MTVPEMLGALDLLPLVAAVIVLAYALALAGFRIGRRLAGRPWTGGRIDRLVAPRTAALRTRHPRLHAFLAARLTPLRFTGLPLLLVVLAAGYIALLAGQVLEELLEADDLVQLDHAVEGAVVAARGPWGIAFFRWLTDFGGTATAVAVGVVTTAFLLVFRRTVFVPPLWVVLTGATATTWAGKYLVGRERPEPLASLVLETPSFPSGHATAAAATYGFLAYVLARNAVRPRVRFEIAFWSSVLVALVAFSRVYLSAHYLSDIAVGALVGGFWLLVGFALAEWRLMADRTP